MVSSGLDNVKVVLVEPSHPGNIGAVARAMKTMGLTRLCLVKPNRYPSAEATARASGADDLLYSAEVVDSLDEALTGCTLVLGTSAREREIAWPRLTPRECAEKVINIAAGSRVALVFGRENSGLTNWEMDRCNYLVKIPSNPAYSSLNLAAAVQIICYELLHAVLSSEMVDDRQEVTGTGKEEPADAEEVAGFFRHLEQVLVQINFYNPAEPKRLMRRLRRLFSRTGLERNEVNILRGILTAVQRSQGK